MKTVLVIGGGITGLSALYSLHKWKEASQSDVQLILAEASDTLGGKINTKLDGDFIMETGADSIVARKMNEMTWIDELGLGDQVVYNATGQSFIFTAGELRAIPADSVFGIPATIESLAKSTLVSADGKVEALRDFYLQDRTFTKDDSIGDFLTYYLGREMVEKQIAPVLSGVYSGKLDDLSISSTLPYLLEYKEKYGSIMKGLEANLEKFRSSGEKKFLSFRNGLSTFINAIEKTLHDVAILTSHQAKQIEKQDQHYRISFTNQEVVEADYVILAVPASVSQDLFHDADLKRKFSQFQNSSLISVYMGFDLPDDLLPEEGTGFITANNQELSCNACTWTSRKWDHTSRKGNLLVRLFYKSSHPAYLKIKDMANAGLLQVARDDIRKSLRIEAEPVTSVVTKWSDNMPTYQIHHRQTVESIEKLLEKSHPGIKMAGCSYYGVGIPDCIKNGMETAATIIKDLEE
ncbi:protoporphyrinogen oxidase [Lederbergia sp. NSJ-179]|uniref:protoporphyrinogen oxidase n=1 Tax=Lederbergia sp. NSJ-179 TaxID=2931402 RepID=UPI001FD3FCD9|nr:protoporphyrinogen oxidase [Lederbergia sp. NSJ-179]MCJ7840723.1 protoporphyrinogen oxidase [Lederbergia sp. NSJ-179]